MKKDKSKDKLTVEEKSSLDWEEDDEEDEEDREFDRFLEEHEELIAKITTLNPVITKDDEWYYEDCWDEDYKQFCLEKKAEKVI